MCEHLLCLYSMVSQNTYLYNNTFPVFLNSFGDADVVLFGLGEPEGDRVTCVQELTTLPIHTLNIVAPNAVEGFPNMRTRYFDWDFHIDVDRFDLDLKGRAYKTLRHRLRQVERLGYHTRLTNHFTSNHTYILARHLARHKLDVWDYEELLSLERFFREHNHGVLMEAYQDETLVGFDVIDFFEDTGIMVIPIGVYLDVPLISHFMMLENLKFAKDKGYTWVDVGPACGVDGLKRFKESWFAQPKFKFYVQQLTVEPKK